MSTTSRAGCSAQVADKAKTVDDRAYFAYLRAITERLAGNNAGARVFLMKSMLLDPNSRWAVKTRYELAGIELASGNWAPAEELARAEAVRLLSGDRKDRLAGIYQEYARRLLEPGDPLIKPDPNAAYDMLVQARELAESPALRASILFAMGRASMAAGNPPGRSKTSSNISATIPPERTGSSVRFQLGWPSQYQSAVAGPPNLDGSGTRDRASQARRAHQGHRRDPGRSRSTILP